MVLLPHLYATANDFVKTLFQLGCKFYHSIITKSVGVETPGLQWSSHHFLSRPTRDNTGSSWWTVSCSSVFHLSTLTELV